MLKLRMRRKARTPAVFAAGLLLIAAFLPGCQTLELLVSSGTTAPLQCDDAATLDRDSISQLRKVVQPLVESTFFTIFHVALDAPCPFWSDDDGKCAMRECSVCNCDEDEVPVAWRAADMLAVQSAQASSTGMQRDPDASALKANRGAAAADFYASGNDENTPSRAKRANSARTVELSATTACESSLGGDALNDVDRSHSVGAKRAMNEWATPSSSDEWLFNDLVQSEVIYVDLLKNPERYTGFSGAQTHRIWSAVYDENCFAFSDTCKSGICEPGTCKEERVLYRLISGIHTSISMHIAHGYLHGTRWGPNLAIFRNRVRAFPERMLNLHVTLAVMLRAIAKVAPNLDPSVYDYSTGDQATDAITARRIRTVLAHPLLAHGCEDLLFDESDMFIQNAEARLPEFRAAFRNISMIMDCVGCEKCRLWGKLQFLGLGTALRVLFSDEEAQRQLGRNEVIAMFNLMYKLLSSAQWIDEMNRDVERNSRLYRFLGMFVAFSTAGMLAVSANNAQTVRRSRSPTCAARVSSSAVDHERAKPDGEQPALTKNGLSAKSNDRSSTPIDSSKVRHRPKQASKTGK